MRLPIDDDEIIGRALAIEPLADGKITLLTYDTGQFTRARNAGLQVVKLSQEVGDEPEEPGVPQTGGACPPLRVRATGHSIMLTCVGSDTVKRAGAFRTLTFCMPCSTIPSDGVALGPVPALQSRFSVWGRLVLSGEIWTRWH